MSAPVTSRVSLDDTLHAIVQLSHEHDLPLGGVSVHAGYAHVFCDRSEVMDWTRWLAQDGEPHIVAWLSDDQVQITVHISGTREGIEWVLVESLPVPAESPVELDATHRPVSLSVLADLLAGGAA